MTDPVALLDLKAFETTDNRHIRLEDDNSSNSANIFYTGDLLFKNNNATGGFIFHNSAGIEHFKISNTGAVKINGGSPAAGKVLTSTDASGNATWQDLANPKLGFTAYRSAIQSINPSTTTTIAFDDEQFDDGSGFNPVTGEYTAPSAGLYHFELSVYWSPMTAREIVYLVKNGARIKFTSTDVDATNLHSQKLNVSVKLAANDIITVQVFHTNASARNVNTSDESTYFKGYKVF